MNEKVSVNLSGKDAARLLEGLTKDPQLRSEDDPSILAEEQFPNDGSPCDASGEDSWIVDGQHHHHFAVGKATYPLFVGGAKGYVERAEEQNSQTVSVHCHNEQPMG